MPAPTRPSRPKSARSAAPRHAKPGPAKPSPAKPSPVAPRPAAAPSRPPDPAAKNSAKSPAQRPANIQARRPKTQPQTRPQPRQKPGHPVGQGIAIVTRRAADRLRGGHLWVYATEIEQLPTSDHPDHPPALIPVADSRGLLLGTALFSPASQIPLRLIAHHAVAEPAWPALLAERLRTAIRQRQPLLNDASTACRLVFSEADDLPGLVLDKYGDLFLLQLLVKPLATPAVRAAVAEVLRDSFAATCPQFTLWERPDPRIRVLEGIDTPAEGPLAAANPTAPAAETIFRLNGLRFHYNASAGQKTGAFLDQRENYAAAARWAAARGATGKALDVCTYQGGFALHLAQVCRSVTGVDASRPALEVAEANLALNRTDSGPIPLNARVDWIEADAFTLLRDLSEPVSGSVAARDWDLIVLDPPAFAKSRRAVEGALRGYKELNLRALRMLRTGGLLLTCSCSHHVHWTDLEAAVAAAALDARRRVRILERRTAALDHPIVLNLPETEYLKCLICEVLA